MILQVRCDYNIPESRFQSQYECRKSDVKNWLQPSIYNLRKGYIYLSEYN